MIFQKKQSQQSLEQQAENDQNIKQQVSIDSKNQPSSKYYENYLQKKHASKINVNEKLQLLKKNQILWQSTFSINLHPSISKTDFESTKLDLIWGNLQLQVFILKLNINSNFFHHNSIPVDGSFGRIYRVINSFEKYAVKSIKITHYQKIFNKYYTGALNLGPEILKLFGYDLLVFNDRVDFFMEHCEPILRNLQFSNQNFEPELIQQIQTLHLFHICHCDIKPENIMYSERLNKAVLIDYGLSRIIKQSPGQKTFTGFVGTYRYASPQMKKLYFLKKKTQIELYYNDAYGLNFAITKICDQLLPEDHQQMHQYLIYETIQRMSYFKNFISIKYRIFCENILEALVLITNQIHFKKSTKKLFVQQFINKQWNQKVLNQSLPQNFETFTLLKQKVLTQMSQQCPIVEARQIDKFLSQYLVTRYEHKYSKYYYLNPNSVDEIINVQNLSFNNQIWQNSQFIQQLFKGIVPLFDPDHDINEGKQKQQDKSFFMKKTQLLQKIYQTKIRPTLDKAWNPQNTILFKINKVLKFFMNYFMASNNQIYLKCLRMIFIQTDDYQSAIQIQEYIFSKYPINSAYFLLRGIYFLDHKKWNNNFSFFCELKYKQLVQNAVVCIEDTALLKTKQMIMNLLSTSLSPLTKVYYVQCRKLVLQILSINKNSCLLQQIQCLNLIIQHTQDLIKLFNFFSGEDSIKNQTLILKTFKQTQQNYRINNHKNHLMYDFSYIKLLQCQKNPQLLKIICDQYLSLVEKEKILYVYQISYLLCSSSLQDKQILKILFTKYLKIMESIQIKQSIEASFGLIFLSSVLIKLCDKNTVIEQEQLNLLLRYFSKLEQFVKTHNLIQLQIINQTLFILCKFYVQLLTNQTSKAYNLLVSHYEQKYKQKHNWGHDYLLQQASKAIISLQIECITGIFQMSGGHQQVCGMLERIFQIFLFNRGIDLKKQGKAGTLFKSMQLFSHFHKIIITVYIKNKNQDKLCQILSMFQQYIYEKDTINETMFAKMTQSDLHLSISGLCCQIPSFYVRQQIYKYIIALKIQQVCKYFQLSILIFWLIQASTRFNNFNDVILFKQSERKRIYILCLFGLDKITHKIVLNVYMRTLYSCFEDVYNLKQLRKQLTFIREQMRVHVPKSIPKFIKFYDKQIRNKINQNPHNYYRNQKILTYLDPKIYSYASINSQNK